MKESYETPTAERLEFDYNEAITASAVASAVAPRVACKNGVNFSHPGKSCVSNKLYWSANSIA